MHRWPTHSEAECPDRNQLDGKLPCHTCVRAIPLTGPARTRVVRFSKPQEAPMRPALSATLTAMLMLFGCTGDHLVEPTNLPGELARARAGKEVAAPSALAVTAMSATRIDLAWTDKSTNETGFELFRSTAGQTGPFALWLTLWVNTTALSDSYAQPQHRVLFQDSRRTQNRSYKHVLGIFEHRVRDHARTSSTSATPSATSSGRRRGPGCDTPYQYDRLDDLGKPIRRDGVSYRAVRGRRSDLEHRSARRTTMQPSPIRV